MLSEDSKMSQPVQYDPNTSVGYFPWEEPALGAVHSYNLTNMATMTSPFAQVMEPEVEARDEAVVESKTNDSTLEEQESRIPDLANEDTPKDVGAHMMRAEGDDSASWIGANTGVGIGLAVMVGIGMLVFSRQVKWE